MYLRFGTGEALLVVAGGVMLGLDIATGQAWWGYLVSIIALMVAFYGGLLTRKR